MCFFLPFLKKRITNLLCIKCLKWFLLSNLAVPKDEGLMLPKQKGIEPSHIQGEL